MKIINAKRATIAGTLAAGVLIAIGGTALAASDSPEAHSGTTAAAPELRITSADYALTYAVLTADGDGFSSTLGPNSVQERHAPGYATVRFIVDGKLVSSYTPLETGSTLNCTATGTVQAPAVDCKFG